MDPKMAADLLAELKPIQEGLTAFMAKLQESVQNGGASQNSDRRGHNMSESREAGRRKVEQFYEQFSEQFAKNGTAKETVVNGFLAEKARNEQLTGAEYCGTAR